MGLCGHERNPGQASENKEIVVQMQECEQTSMIHRHSAQSLFHQTVVID
jgi:hypothetical protein